MEKPGGRGRRVFILLSAAIGILLAAGSTTSSAAEDAGKTARQLYKKGLWSFRAQDIEGAIESFRASAKLDPAYAHPSLALGRILHDIFDREMHRYNDAVEAYDRATEALLLSPPDEKSRDLFQVYWFRGLLLLKGGDYDSAVSSFRKFIDVYPDFEEMGAVKNALGIAYYYLNQYDLAVNCFKEAMTADPKLTEASFNLRSVFTRLSSYNEAQVLYRSGHFDRALERVENLKEYAPRYIPGRQLEAMTLIRLGRRADGIAVFREILGIYPDHPLSYRVRIEAARELIADGGFDEAQGLLMENLARFPTPQDPLSQREIMSLLSQIGRSR